MKATDILAIYAAVLSSVVAWWNVAQSRPRFKVDLLPGVDGPDGAMRSGAFVVIRNVSSRDVHIATISMLIPFRRPSARERIANAWRAKRVVRTMGWASSILSNYGIDSGCPASIEPGQSHRVFIAYGKIEEMLGDADRRTLRAQAQDQLWTNVYSSSLGFAKRVTKPTEERS